MRFRVLSGVALLVVAGTAGAQNAPANSQCTGVTANACQQAVDLFTYVSPLLGTSIVGGNTTMGQGGSLGTRLGLIPHVSVGVRVNAVFGGIPDFAQPAPLLPGATGPSPKPASAIETTKLPIPMPAFDAAIGVFKGIPLALSNVGGVDLLLSAAYVPKVEKDEITIEPETPLQIGYGFRVGLLQESLVVPGLGFSWMKRDMPTTDLVGRAGSASLSVTDFKLKTSAWRLTASKSLILFGLAVGVGQDKYETGAIISASIPPATMSPFTLAAPEVTRTNYFADLSMNLPFIKIVGTGGMVQGGDIPTYYDYDKEADASRLYGSVGLRFTF